MPKRQKGNLSPNPNNEAGLSSITTRNIIGYVSDLMVIGFIVNFGTYFNKIELSLHGEIENCVSLYVSSNIEYVFVRLNLSVLLSSNINE